MTSSPKRAIGFKVLRGRPADGDAPMSLVGTPASRQAPNTVVATRHTTTPCPVCSDERLAVVPAGVLIGRIVAVEDGVVAVDPLPPRMTPLHCRACNLMFYSQQDIQ